MSNWELNQLNSFFPFYYFWGSIAQLINKLIDKESLAGHSRMCSTIGGYCFFRAFYCSKLPARSIEGEKGWSYLTRRKNSTGKIISDKTDPLVERFLRNESALKRYLAN